MSEHETPRQTPVVVTPRWGNGRRRVPSVSPDEKVRLQDEWAALEERRAAIMAMEQELAGRWPDDLSRPMSVGVVPQMAGFPGVPGSPLPVKLSWGTWLTALGMLVAALGAVIFVLNEGRHHLNDEQRHLDDKTGVGWGTGAQMGEFRGEIRASQAQMEKRIDTKLENVHERLEGSLIRTLAPAKYPRWKAAREQERGAAPE